jgi:hypothetical protein
MSKSLLIFSLATLALLGCSQTHNNETQANTSHYLSLMPTPADQTSWEAQLSRFAGQTEYLTVDPWSGDMAEAVVVSGEPESSGREEQEADVFKIGKPGSKEVYLLNNYRGLQVISFAKGADKPEILGRVNPTGNYPQAMYSDLDNNRLIVIENREREGKSASRLLIYNVSKSASPRIETIVDVKGYSVDSRIVGSVLYLATIENQSGGSIWSNSQNIGKVQSFSLSGQNVKAISEFQMKLPVLQQDMMNIQVSGKGKDAKYYLVAVQSDMYLDWWSWWSGPSAVEVVDITDPNGKIQPVMTANVKGFITERSSTIIRDGYLVVTSNYMVDPNADDLIMRIAVEAFKLPTKESQVISSQEAQYRQLHIDRQVEMAPKADKEAVKETLLSDKALGLKGRFVQEENGSLKKIVADSDVTVGDTRGESASLQDVRYDGNYLYAFWVPADQVDPLDVFDIGNLDQGVKHLGRLEFDGWIERAFPITYQGQRFILGLGWIVPAVDTEDTRRTIQAKLFEVKTEKVKERDSKGQIITRDQVVATVVPGAEVVLSMDEGSFYSDLNEADRYIQMIMDPKNPGKGHVLFEASSYAQGSYRQGGQMIHFDLNEAVLGLGSTSVTEGPFLEANQGWLRRIFANPELGNMYNTFSDKNLSTFDTKNSAKGLVQTLSVLELARNINAYYVLQGTQSQMGVQIVSNNDYSDIDSVEIRSVAIDAADSEVTKISDVVKIDGNMQDSLVYKDAKGLLVLSAKDVSTSKDRESYTTVTNYTVTKVNLDSKQKLQISQKAWNETFNYTDENSTARSNARFENNQRLTLLSDGSVLIKTQVQTQILKADQSLSLVAMDASTCPKISENKSVQIKEMDGKIVFFAQERVSIDKAEAAASKNTISIANLKGNTLICGAEINIPGTPIMMTDTQVVTEDIYALDSRIKKSDYVGDDGAEIYELQTRKMNALSLVEIEKNSKATLLDLTTDISTSYGTEQTYRFANEQKLYVLRNQKSDSGLIFYEDAGGYSDSSSTQAELVAMSIENKRFVSTIKNLDGAQGYARMVGLVAGEKQMLVVDSEAGMQVFALEQDQRPQVVSFKAVNENGVQGPSVDVLAIGGLGYSPMINYTKSQNSLEIASGLRGVIQIYLSK